MMVWFSLVAAGAFLAAQVNGGAIRKKQDESSSPAAYFQSIWQINGTAFAAAAVHLRQEIHFSYTITDAGSVHSQDEAPTMALLWTDAPSSSAPTSSNTYEVTNVTYTCTEDPHGGGYIYTGANGTAVLSLDLQRAESPPQQDGSVDNFFLCFATGVDPVKRTLTCESYSPFFNIDGIPAAPVAEATPTATSLIVPTTPLLVTLNTAFVTPLPSGVSAPLSSAATVTSISTTAPSSYTITTVSETPVGTTTVTPSGTAEASTPQHTSKGLSTGALVGIIVGGVAALLILALLSLLCIRRRRRSRSNTVESLGSQTDHVLLAQPYHTTGRSRDLTTEKDEPGSMSPVSILDAPLVGPTLPQNPRHSYDSLNASAPYSGLAAIAPKRREAAPSPPISQSTNSHPHSHSQTLSHSLLSREISSSSGPLTRGSSDASGPLSPRSTERGGDDFEDYHDVPIYGDARHTPTLYDTHSSLHSPFLGEEGMTAEEMARLDEEERRIDAAIAEAERSR